MAQHFLLSAAARSLSPAKVLRMSEEGAQNVFARVRWLQTSLPKLRLRHVLRLPPFT